MSPVDRWLIRVAAAITLALILGGCSLDGSTNTASPRRPVDEADCVALGGVYSDAACRAGGSADCDVCILPWAAR